PTSSGTRSQPTWGSGGGGHVTRALLVEVAFWVFALAALVSGWRVFRTDSMVRASFLLLTSFLNVGGILLLLSAEYLGLALLFMMAVEMMVMAVFMVMFMMNPAGLNPMQMVHQHAAAVGAGVVMFGGMATVAFAAAFPDRPVRTSHGLIESLGSELLGDSMLVFQSAGVTLLAAMVGAVALASRRGRFGDGDEGSVPPPLDPHASPDVTAAGRGDGAHGHHAHVAGHEDHGGHGGHEGHG
ncbi:MAG TPA: NADH-quinone oxidoreductase subunit J, partial [Nitriliruptorales bacterium]|nr:NADH-quinone oxidoreductase subunit J [Nitriliruptorales bacterium]